MPTQIKEYQKKVSPKKQQHRRIVMKKSLCPKKNEQISHQNEHRNYCSLSVPVILSSPKKRKRKRRSYVLPEHIIISTQKPSRKKQNRIKTSTQQHVRSCTTTVYVNLSMNTFENSSRKPKADAKVITKKQTDNK